MAKIPSKELHLLIHSMSQAEKRNFKLFVNHGNRGENQLFIKLFDLINKQQVYDEGAVLKSRLVNNKVQLRNAKFYLYKLILKQYLF